MIESHDLPISPQSFLDESEDYVSKRLFAENAALRDLLVELNANIGRMANFSERQREEQPQKLISLGSDSGLIGAGTAAGATFQTTTAFRVTNIVISGSTAGDKIQFSVGVVKYNFWTAQTPGTFAFPITIDRGIDLNAQDLTGGTNAFTFLVFGYPV